MKSNRKLLWIVSILCSVVFWLSIIVIIGAYSCKLYSFSKEEVVTEYLNEQVVVEALKYVNHSFCGTDDSSDCEASILILDSNNNRITSLNYESIDINKDIYTIVKTPIYLNESDLLYTNVNQNYMLELNLVIRYDSSMYISDEATLGVRIISILDACKYLSIIVSVFALLFNFVVLSLLARRELKENASKLVHYKNASVDLAVLFLFLSVIFVINLTPDILNRFGMSNSISTLLVIVAVCVLLFSCLSVLISLSIIIQWFEGSILKNLVIRKIVDYFNPHSPIVMETCLFILLISIVEFCVLWATNNASQNLLFYWGAGKVILIPFVIMIAIQISKSFEFGEEVLNRKKIDDSDYLWFFKSFRKNAENLNDISSDIDKALEAKEKSERMKIELIANISHDIKTPLTSIINYSDLLSSRIDSNDEARKFADVLVVESGKLKLLLEDLIEISKMNSGDIDIELVPCDVDTLFSQIIAEYEDRLATSNLKLVSSISDEPLSIMADLNKLWRVFNNLMTNICKYSLPDSRVYLNAYEADDCVYMSFTNVSKEELNVSAEELLGRFVRGDKSRRVEGHGLGLSIAQSLVEIQNGSMELKIDGDLFKVVLKFKSEGAH